MIISFSVENWMSFRDRVTLSMVASREHQHGERVPRVGEYSMRILPVTVIYGGNASGKTNLFRALSFAKRLVVDGTKPDGLIPVQPFRLDSLGVTRPTRFAFEILVDETIYEFSFAVSRKAVLEERLVRVSITSESVLYDRVGENITFNSALSSDQFLKFAFKGTRDNQLFLTNSVSQKVENFRPVYDWFEDSLELVAPDSRFGGLEHALDQEDPLFSMMNKMLPQLDTGIEHLGMERIPFDSSPLPESLKAKIQEDLKEGDSGLVEGGPDDERFVVTRNAGELVVKRMVAYHPRQDGTEVKFDLRHESDGSRRMIDLLPALLEVSAPQSRSVYVFDEIDRSLHPMLMRRLLEVFVSSCSVASRAQLLFTTHNVQLMDQRLFRRDEMWVTERNEVGVSNLISFSEYKDVRYDKDIRKSYLQGRLGGVPRLRVGGVLTGLSYDEREPRNGERD